MRKGFLFCICLISQFSFAGQRALNCSFQGLKGKQVVELGSSGKVIDPKFDFSIDVPKSEDRDWATFLENLKIVGSVETPEKGWVGLAFVYEHKPNDGWACIKLIKGQNLALTKSSGELTVQARCAVK